MSYCAIHGRPLDTAGVCDFCDLYGGREYQHSYVVRYSVNSVRSKEEILEDLRAVRQRLEELESELRGQP